MGRKAKVTEEQLEEAIRRNLKGESLRKLGAEYGVCESSLRQRMAKFDERMALERGEIKTAGKLLYRAECAVRSLPKAAQISARGLAETLLQTYGELATTAQLSASTARYLSQCANNEVRKIDQNNSLIDVDALKGVAVLQSMANDAAKIPSSLIQANKELLSQTDALNQNMAEKSDDELKAILDGG